MTDIGKPSTLTDLRHVVVIIHQKQNDIDTVKMFLRDSKDKLVPMRWTKSGDQEIYSCSRNTVTDAIIPMMSIITGFKFQRAITDGDKTTFEREDFSRRKENK